MMKRIVQIGFRKSLQVAVISGLAVSAFGQVDVTGLVEVELGATASDLSLIHI